ncbi:hypothetical protein [Frankia sp. CiP3]|uniref:hypothetical protein n=1 Tax=Frankia sp. CiP3 TaxID=2880971 RepID=UPI001EF53DF3|nr:hypothetical protein [Frankia sp. CiP3]
MSAEINTSVCIRCGMPLAYDQYITATDSGVSTYPAGDLCSYCTETNRTTGHGQGNEKNQKWILSLIIQIYHNDRLRRILGSSATSRFSSVLPGSMKGLVELVASIPEKRPEAKYDAVVLYSGGKDSSWMLMELARRDLRVAAWMLNQGYQSPIAIKNAQKLCERLGIELIIAEPERRPMDSLFRLGFMVNEDGDRDLVRSAMTYGSACWPCFATIAAHATVFCYDNDIPFCFIGTQKGQNRLDLNGSPVLSGGGLPAVDTLVEKFVSRLRSYALKKDAEAARLLDSQPCRTALVPFYEIVAKPSVDEQIADLEKIGWSKPKNTGTCSTNCMINELGRKIMRNQYGFDLYQVIDANERRLATDPRPEPIAALDEDAVRRGAKLIELTPVESMKFGVKN